MLQVSADWGNVAAARTGSHTAQRGVGGNFSRRRGRTCRHRRTAASGSPPTLLLTNESPARPRSLPPSGALYFSRVLCFSRALLSVFAAVSNPSHAFSRRPEQRTPNKASRLLWRPAWSTLAIKRRQSAP
jgi:hypothetical protein